MNPFSWLGNLIVSVIAGPTDRQHEEFLAMKAPVPKSSATNRKTLAAAIVTIARTEATLGIVETSRNQGPGIEKYWHATSYPLGYLQRQPWCAAAMCYVLLKAMELHYGKTTAPFDHCRWAAVNGWPKWAAKEPGWKVLDPAVSRVRAGDFVCFDFNGREKEGGTHIGVAVSDEDASGTFETAEGNTDSEGSREGNGYFLKTRTRKGVFAIIRYSGK